MLEYLKRLLIARPELVSFLESVFAALVLFSVLDMTTEQFAGAILVINRVFDFVSKVAFKKDIDELAQLDAARNV